jgi:hypothetical protein
MMGELMTQNEGQLFLEEHVLARDFAAIGVPSATVRRHTPRRR